jgi:hypothetical protein
VPLFATPDFGTGALIMLFVFAVWAVVLLLAGVGILCGAGLLTSKSPKIRAWGLALLLGSGLVPLLCCLGPPQIIRVAYGNYPVGSDARHQVKKGMSAEEVRAALGSPHRRSEGPDGEGWYYWIDSFGASWFCVDFGPEGRVIATHGN